MSGSIAFICSGEEAHCIFAGASFHVEQPEATIKSFNFRGYLFASDKLVSNINCKLKPERPYEDSLSIKSIASNLLGSVGSPSLPTIMSASL